MNALRIGMDNFETLYDIMMKNGKHTRAILLIKDMASECVALGQNKYLYVGILTLIIGIKLNFYSQEYLLRYINNGSSLPVLSDLILDNIPFWDIDFLYDIFSVVSLVIFSLDIVQKRRYQEIPYFLLLSGLFQIVRGFFIILTPFGHPAGFDGTEGIFNGFSDIELGVYPSGHTGIN